MGTATVTPVGTVRLREQWQLDAADYLARALDLYRHHRDTQAAADNELAALLEELMAPGTTALTEPGHADA